MPELEFSLFKFSNRSRDHPAALDSQYLLFHIIFFKNPTQNPISKCIEKNSIILSLSVNVGHFVNLRHSNLSMCLLVCKSLQCVSFLNLRMCKDVSESLQGRCFASKVLFHLTPAKLQRCQKMKIGYCANSNL